MTGLYTIPLSLPFVDVLAEGLLKRAGDDPLQLSRMLVMLPTQRAARALREAFLRHSDTPLLLPRMQALGDLDADELTLQGTLDAPPAVSPLRRQSLLARALLQSGFSETPAQAAGVARSLARFLDEMQAEELLLDSLDGIVQDSFATHWQKTLDFLAVIRDVWPLILAAEHAIDPALRRRMVVDAMATFLTDNPPAAPVLIAGSNGSLKAVRRLMKVVAGLPQGEVILHGLDRDLDEAAWQDTQPSHPCYAHRLVIDDLALTRRQVDIWPEAGKSIFPCLGTRERLVGEVMRPSQTVEEWARLPGVFDEACLKPIRRMECTSPRDEADSIACLMREVLETPGKRAFLVTPDRELARLVAASLRRWDVEVDDSAGQPLSATPPGAFLRLTAEMTGADFAPLPLLACLKHPLALGGLPAGEFRRRARRLEMAVLRGPLPAPGFVGLKAALSKAELETGELETLASWMDDLETLASPFARLIQEGSDFPQALREHVAFAQALATSEGGQAGDQLWAHEAGEALAEFIDEALGAFVGFPPALGTGYAALLDSLLAACVVRSPVGQHPRLAILGTIEARLQQADLVIMGGLNEGTWPEQDMADPFLSRQMRAAIGLPPPEFRTGLSAHDFAAGLAAPQVVFSRAVRVKGAPTVASRWVLRLDAVLRASGSMLSQPAAPVWMRGLDIAAVTASAPRPEPKPPLTARPRRMSVTDIQTWLDDPYRLYARRILKLRPLDPVGAEPGAADKGTIIHEALDRFTKIHRKNLPPDALEQLIATGRALFDERLLSPALETFWWPRFQRVAEWFVETEHERRRIGILPAIMEVSGQHDLSPAAGSFTVIAKADRIDRHPDGTLEIIDYKTGTVPHKHDVETGAKPQLPIEAAIAERGGFAGLLASPVALVSYWKLSGASEAGKIVPHAVWPRDILALLEALVERFDDPATPYWAKPPDSSEERLGYHAAYEHLERVREWIGYEGAD